MMNRGLLLGLLAIAVLLVTEDALGNLTGVRSTPRQSRVLASRDNVLSVNWRVSTTADHTTGVTSPIATIVDPATGAVLLTVNTTFDAAGAGPFSFRETVLVDAATVRTWIQRGTRQALIVRTFADPAGSTVTGSVVLRLNSSQLQATRDPAPSQLAVTSLRLEFDSGNNTMVTGVGESVGATLTLQYTGSGMLRGRWQIAEPESPDAAPLYRTLALVNTNLGTSQRSVLRSPALPTGRPGRYLLRFCVTSQATTEPSADALCPDPELLVQATYQVQGSDAQRIEAIRGLSPDRRAAGPQTVFSWDSAPGAHIYQLQVFALAPADAGLPASKVESDRVEPVFVAGMVLDADTRETALSALVQSKLEDGRHYLWRITAHDETGRMIGRSVEATFVYAPRK